MQQHFWNFMVQTRSWIYYLDEYAQKSYQWNRRVKCFSAITSSASIAAWTVWKNCAFVWALLIAISQVVAAVKDYLPFTRRLIMIKSMQEGIKLINIEMEHEWLNVANGYYTEEEINDLLFKYKKLYSEIESKYLGEELLVERADYMEIADIKTCDYYKINF